MERCPECGSLLNNEGKCEVCMDDWRSDSWEDEYEAERVRQVTQYQVPEDVPF